MRLSRITRKIEADSVKQRSMKASDNRRRRPMVKTCSPNKAQSQLFPQEIECRSSNSTDGTVHFLGTAIYSSDNSKDARRDTDEWSTFHLILSSVHS